MLLLARLLTLLLTLLLLMILLLLLLRMLVRLLQVGLLKDPLSNLHDTSHICLTRASLLESVAALPPAAAAAAAAAAHKRCAAAAAAVRPARVPGARWLPHEQHPGQAGPAVLAQ